MIKGDRIPESYYSKLVELMGKEEADAFIEKVKYDIKAISMRISYLEFVQYVKDKPLKAILFIAPVIYLLIRLLWIFIIEPLVK